MPEAKNALRTKQANEMIQQQSYKVIQIIMVRVLCLQAYKISID